MPLLLQLLLLLLLSLVVVVVVDVVVVEVENTFLVLPGLIKSVFTFNMRNELISDTKFVKEINILIRAVQTERVCFICKKTQQTLKEGRLTINRKRRNNFVKMVLK